MKSNARTIPRQTTRSGAISDSQTTTTTTTTTTTATTATTTWMGHDHHHVPSSESMLSRSLGDFPSPINSRKLQRGSSETSDISYRGYLLKRSNQPAHEAGTESEPEAKAEAEAAVCVDDEPDSRMEKENATPPRPQHLLVETFSDFVPNLVSGIASSTTKSNSGPISSKNIIDLSPVERSLQMIASFFGLGTNNQNQRAAIDMFSAAENDTLRAPNPPPKIEEPPVILRTPSRSAPITFGKPTKSSSSSYSSSSGKPPLFRRDTAPSPKTDHNLQPPADFIDPNDNHIWRAKYCVLEEGILYFYRNANDGESIEAKAERIQTAQAVSENPTTHTSDIADLSKSPMARVHPPCLKIGESIGSGERGVIWEKRVMLNCVGAVRSAAVEYDGCAFELVAVQDDDEPDQHHESDENEEKLVLRARNLEEMNKWLFQVHLSLVSLMMNLVESVGASPAWANGLAFDIHHPPFQHQLSVPPGLLVQPSPNHDFLALSPRVVKKPAQNVALSHGHGRSGMHRRRRDSDAASFVDLAMEAPVPFTFEASGPAIVPPAMAPSLFQPHTPGDRDKNKNKESVAFSSVQTTASHDFGKTQKKPPAETLPPRVTPLRKAECTSQRPNVMPKSAGGRYIPPSKRREMAKNGKLGDETAMLSLKDRASSMSPIRPSSEQNRVTTPYVDETETGAQGTRTGNGQHSWYLGGCADPVVADTSILDPKYIPRSASKVGRIKTEPMGIVGGRKLANEKGLRWEIGAASECGVRDSNEDAFLLCSDISAEASDEQHASLLWSQDKEHGAGVFAIFDGHNGNQAARYSAETLIQHLRKEFESCSRSSFCKVEDIEVVLSKAVAGLDDAFCRLCVEDKRAWESGTTAIIAAIIDDHVVLANIGDCSAVIGRSVELNIFNEELEKSLTADGWSQGDNKLEDKWPTEENGYAAGRWSFWKEVADVHCPSRSDELARIKTANGWISTEQEIPIGQLQRMDFHDPDVVDILKRCFMDRAEQSSQSSTSKKCSAAPQRIIQISRVCSELAVSRAIGDRDFKAAFNQRAESGDDDPAAASSAVLPDDHWWEGPDFLPYPEKHSGKFRGDLITAVPEIRTMKIEQEGIIDEFLLLACDGLWDVVDPDEAVRITRGLLFEKKWTAKETAARLARLAIHLGSSDNVTVILIRFF